MVSSAPASLTVTQDSCGRYFLSFVVDTEPDTLPRLETESGIDLGLSSSAVLSDRTKIHSPRFLRRAEKKLKRLQRELSRKAKGSKNRAKARIKVAHQHAKVADRRRDWHHKASTQIIRENQAVFVEDLAVSGLGRTRLAKSVYDAGWSAFVGMLEYKAALHGRTFAKVHRAFPSSQICSACGFRDGSVRRRTCRSGTGDRGSYRERPNPQPRASAPHGPTRTPPEPPRPVVAARIATGTAEAAVVQGKRAHRPSAAGSVRHGPRSGGPRRCREGGSAQIVRPIDSRALRWTVAPNRGPERGGCPAATRERRRSVGRREGS
ncbi:hypothetical protein MBT84_00665 [Streptomyces sp. MBT84]|nr:hypothetical protein [Streptomyces sp. MBT84]